MERQQFPTSGCPRRDAGFESHEADQMIFHWPDNPVSSTQMNLFQLDQKEPGRYLGQLKWDGWRNIIYKDAGKWVRHSKYDVGAQAKTPLPDCLTTQLDALNLPDGTGFDSEWMGGRVVAELKGRHFLVLLDLHYLDGKWQGDLTCENRLKSLKKLVEGHKAKTKTATPDIEIVQSAEIGLLALFEASKKLPLTEGIVAKARDSKLVGNLNQAVENKHWIKVKWR